MSAKAWEFTFLISFVLTATMSATTFPELSSLEPLEFDETLQRLVARGEARLDFDNTRIRADRVSYYKEFALVDADGNVAMNREDNRLITQRLSYDGNENTFFAEVLRTGRWPYYISAASAGGTEENITVNDAILYYGNPHPFTLKVHSDEVQYVKEEDLEYLSAKGATFRIGILPLFYLPYYRHYVSAPPYYIDTKAGSDGQLGSYLQTTSLFPISSSLRLGVNLDYYTKRGILAGPTAQYLYDSATQSISSSISVGFIEDREEALDPVVSDSGRRFASWRYKHHVGERFTATATGSYRSDLDVLRDFRDDIYDENRRPDNFVEAVYARDNWLVSAFGRFRPNDFQIVQERLPELSIDLLPIPLFNTGVYHQASIRYSRLYEDIEDSVPEISIEGRSDRFNLSYQIQYPFFFTNWLTFTPVAGVRYARYENQEIDPFFIPVFNGEDPVSREIYELGFDLGARAYASYPTVNRTWEVQGLYHLLRPTIRYRYYSVPDDLNRIATIDRRAFDTARDLLDLGSLRNVDQISEKHLIRLGVENFFQTRSEQYGSRTLAALNFYQDILLDKATRFDGTAEDTFNATWIELILKPAPWLKFDLASRFETESLTLEELRTRMTLQSGDAWEVGLSTDLLNRQIDQYRLDFIYRVNARYSLLSDMQFNADTNQFTRFRAGVHTRVGSTWELIYGVIFREDARNESDFEFRIQARLARH